MTEKATRRQDTRMIPDEQRVCPICNLPTVRLIRGKIYCGNCGFIES